MEFFKNFDQNSNQKLPINFSEEDIFRIPQKITNSDDYSSRISIRILVGNAAVADCGILMEFFNNFDWWETLVANTSDNFEIP